MRRENGSDRAGRFVRDGGCRGGIGRGGEHEHRRGGRQRLQFGHGVTLIQPVGHVALGRQSGQCQQPHLADLALQRLGDGLHVRLSGRVVVGQQHHAGRSGELGGVRLAPFRFLVGLCGPFDVGGGGQAARRQPVAVLLALHHEHRRPRGDRLAQFRQAIEHGRAGTGFIDPLAG